MDKNSTFSSDRLCFRGISTADTAHLVAWRSNPQIIRYFRNQHPITRKDHERWYQTVYLWDSGRFDFIVIEKQAKKPIGTVGINHIDSRECSCEISYMIAEPAFQRKGYAVEAIVAMMNTAMREGLHTFFAEVHSQNTASRRTIEKLGYICYNVQYPLIIYCKRENLNVSHSC